MQVPWQPGYSTSGVELLYIMAMCPKSWTMGPVHTLIHPLLFSGRVGIGAVMLQFLALVQLLR